MEILLSMEKKMVTKVIIGLTSNWISRLKISKWPQFCQRGKYGFSRLAKTYIRHIYKIDGIFLFIGKCLGPAKYCSGPRIPDIKYRNLLAEQLMLWALARKIVRLNSAIPSPCYFILFIGIV